MFRSAAACCVLGAMGLVWANRPAAAQQAGALAVSPKVNGKTIPLYDVFEITFDHDGRYENPFFDVSVEVVFTSPTGKTIKVGGFYFGSEEPAKVERQTSRNAQGREIRKNVYGYEKATLWKARFSPAEAGQWTYKWTVNNKAGAQGKGDGEFVGVKGRAERALHGFVKQDANDPFQWVCEDGTGYFPFGLQSGWGDYAGHGSILAGNGMEGPYIARENAPPAPAGAMYKPGPGQGALNGDVWFRNFSYGGFNLVRFSNDTGGCMKLFEDLDQYNVHNMRMLDEFFQYARKYQVRVYFTMFGDMCKEIFNSAPEKQEDIAKVKRYIDYCVNRWGVLVDFWELTNEQYPDDRWPELMAGYLKSVDPYKHAVSTSYEKPELANIDINSPHWYSEDASELESDAMTVQRCQDWRRFGKPIILGEQGNNRGRQRYRDYPRYEIGGNWDVRSAVRMRIRVWTALIHEVGFIYWDTSYAKNGYHSNIWLGPKERQYTRVLNHMAEVLGGGISKTRNLSDRQVSVREDLRVRGYHIDTKERILVYLHHYENHTMPVKGVEITLNVPKAGKGYWISPEDASIVGVEDVKEGKGQKLIVPEFLVDIALLITNGPAPDIDHDGIPNDKDDDNDNDGVPNAKDAYPLNPEETEDKDQDMIGDVIDADDDGDGVGDDQNKNGIPDCEEKDIDGDGYPKGGAIPWDAFPWNPKEWKDTDGDGIGDNSDPDIDGDGFSNEEEKKAGTDALDRLSFPAK